MGLLNDIIAACKDIEDREFEEETEIYIDEEWSTIHKYDGAQYEVQLDFKWDPGCYEKHRTILHFSQNHVDNYKIALMKEAFDENLVFDYMAKERSVEVKIHITGILRPRTLWEHGHWDNDY